MTAKQAACFIWYDSEGKGRDLYTYFRRSFTLRQPPSKAAFHIFVDQAYLLYVNGQYVQCGPVRFDPRFPMHDTIDLAPYLRKGRNSLAIKAHYFGQKTYLTIPIQAGFIGWGSLQDGTKTISLNTHPTLWKALPCRAHHHYASKSGFALYCPEILDQSKDAKDWNQIDCDEQAWPKAVALTHQTVWGKPEPRSIPFLSMAPITSKVRAVFPLEQAEILHSFTVPVPHFYEDNKADFSKFIAYTTWIYSPKAQIVTVGSFWGEHWLNGTEQDGAPDSQRHSLRRNQLWALKKGWNHYFGKVGAYRDSFEFYLAFPKDAGIIISATKQLKTTLSFKRTPVLSATDYTTHLEKKLLPYEPTELLKEVGGWIPVRPKEKAQSAYFETGWDHYRDPIEAITSPLPEGRIFKKEKYPDGFAILLELEHTRTLFPRLIAEGVRGATIDISWAERLNADNAHVCQTSVYALSDRLICNQNSINWQPLHPRGARYIMLTFRNTRSDIQLTSFKLASASYPTTLKGRFTCSDPLLNEIWQMGMRTESVNMEDVYDDCVTRERGMYIRDTIIQYHINMAAFGDQALMKRCIQLYGQSPAPDGKFRAVFPNSGTYTISDFSLNMVEGYRDYYRYSGDVESIRRDWPAILKNLQWFHELSDEREDKLLDADWNKKRGIDSFYGGFHGDNSAPHSYMAIHGIHCGFTCGYVCALRSAEELARVVGDATAEHEIKQRADMLVRQIREKFWNEEKGCYSDNLTRDTHSVHASLMAVRAGVVTDEQLPSIRKHASNELRSIFINGYDPSGGTLCGPSFSFYLFEGLYMLGLPDAAEGMMRQGWGWLLGQGLKTCTEFWKLHFSQCHAWSGSPTWYLSKNILGIHFPKAPDLNEVEIRVQAGTVITAAEGSYPYPTGQGTIDVKWHMEQDRRIFDYVKAPDGVRVTIKG